MYLRNSRSPGCLESSSLRKIRETTRNTLYLLWHLGAVPQRRNQRGREIMFKYPIRSPEPNLNLQSRPPFNQLSQPHPRTIRIRLKLMIPHLRPLAAVSVILAYLFVFTVDTKSNCSPAHRSHKSEYDPGVFRDLLKASL